MHELAVNAMTSDVAAAADESEWWQQLTHGSLARLVEQPQTGKHALHVVEACAEIPELVIVPDSVTLSSRWPSVLVVNCGSAFMSH